MTSAPSCRRSIPADGAATKEAASTTRTPSRGRLVDEGRGASLGVRDLRHVLAEAATGDPEVAFSRMSRATSMLWIWLVPS